MLSSYLNDAVTAQRDDAFEFIEHQSDAVEIDLQHHFGQRHLYYPSRRQHSAAFALLLERLRYRG